MKTVLVIDGGGRGNALAHAFSRSKHVGEVYVTPGNAGVYEYGGTALPLTGETREERIPEIIEHAREIEADLVVPGPEGWISAGIVDTFQRETTIPIAGPTKHAAILETSKCDTKDYLADIGVSIPEYRNFEDPDEAIEWARQWYDEHDTGLVPKADGIAAGKGAFVTDTFEETKRAIETIASEAFNEEYDGAGERIVIEERLEGEELSFFAVTDGETVAPFGTARDYKRRFDEPTGYLIDSYFDGINPNTGGMGGYSPVPTGERLEQTLLDDIVRPAVENLDQFSKADDEYRGILHLVTMVTEDGPKVLEFNVRDGDPEAQVRLPRLDGDLYEIFSAIPAGELDSVDINWSDKACVGVCAVSGPPYKDGKRVGGGYPGHYISKQPIFLTGSPDDRIGPEGVGAHVDGMVYHNGTDLHGEGEDAFLRTRGGRVLTFTAQGATVEQARERAYADVETVHFPFMSYRDRIGLNEDAH